MGFRITGNLISAFLQFVMTLLKEQGISHQDVVTNFVAESGLSPAQHRDLVDTLREHSLDLTGPVMPEGKIVPGADNSVNPVVVKPVKGTFTETDVVESDAAEDAVQTAPAPDAAPVPPEVVPVAPAVAPAEVVSAQSETK